jgi:hypothetical protein
MAEGHRLGDLEMREARHRGGGMPVGEVDERALQFPRERVDLVARRAHVEPHVGRDLIVARARGVQPLARVADERDEPPLDVEMDVLGFQRPLELARAELVADRRHAALDVREIRCTDHAARREHPRVGERAGDVELGEPLVEPDRRRIAQHPRVDALGEPAGPLGVGATRAGVTHFLGLRHGGLKNSRSGLRIVRKTTRYRVNPAGMMTAPF